jgi:hypothetical protein
MASHNGGNLLCITEEPHFVGEGLKPCVNLVYEGVNRVIIGKIDAAVGSRAVSSDLAGVGQNAKSSGTATHQRDRKFT